MKSKATNRQFIINNYAQILLLTLLSISIQAQIFIGTGTGIIPDSPGPECASDGVPLDILFDVSGVQTPLLNVEIMFDINHSWLGDIAATLIAPTGEEHVLFARTGAMIATACGDASDLGGLYNFTDFAFGGNWWTVAENIDASTAMPSGNYQSTESGPFVGTPVPFTVIMDTFRNLSDANGIWTLRLIDSGADETGILNSAELFLADDVIFINGFE